tara:strand:- start:5774 stop:6166 length:393 start_codon:yes stop_codon:yes gene_type:complete
MSEKRKLQLVETLLKLTKEWDAYVLSVEHGFGMLRVRYASIPDEEFNKLKAEYGHDYYVSKIIKTYAEDFSEKEIEDLIAFHSSPLGKKVVNSEFVGKLSKLTINWATILDIKCQECAGVRDIRPDKRMN